MKYKFLVLIILLTAMCTRAAAQSRAIDSLKTVLLTLPEDTNRVNVYIDLCNHLRDRRELDLVLVYTDSAQSLSHRLNYEMGQVRAHALVGTVELYKGNFPKALEIFQNVLKSFIEMDDKSKIAATYHNIGMAYRNLGDLPKSLQYQLNASRLFEELRDSLNLGHSSNNIGVLYSNQKKYEQAISYFLKAADIFKKFERNDFVASAYSNIGLSYASLQKYHEAIEYHLLAKKINENLNLKSKLIYNFNDLNYTHGSFGNYNEAYQYGLKAISLIDELGEKSINKNTMASIFINTSSSLIQMMKQDINKEGADKKYNEADQYLSKALQYAIESGNKQQLSNLYREYSNMYSFREDYQKALENYKLSVSYRDSIFNETSDKQTSQLKIQYEVEKKDKEIELLNKENEIKKLKLNEQRGALLLAQLQHSNQQKQLLLLNKNMELQELSLAQAQINLIRKEAETRAREAELAKTEREKELLVKESQLQSSLAETQKIQRNSILGGTVLLLIIAALFFNRYRTKQQQKRLAERMRISADLHDEIGSALSSINILSGIAVNKMDTDKTAAQELVSRINSDAKRMHESMYDIIWEVKPENDSLEKVITRMRQYASEILEAKNIQLRFPKSDSISTLEINSEKRHALYLIFKEAVNNIAKYSQATEAVVSLTRDKGSLVLSVSENGKGFNPDTVQYGNGINNMKRRAEHIHAGFSLEASPGKGTKLTLNIPIP